MSDRLSKYRKHTQWRRNEAKRRFCVELCHSSRAGDPKFDEPAVLNLWTLYAYIYPGHPKFAALCLVGDRYYDAGLREHLGDDLPLHCGATFFHIHRDGDGKACSVQFGCDYDHLHDDRYRRADCGESMIAEADDLHDYLVSRLEPKEATDGK